MKKSSRRNLLTNGVTIAAAGGMLLPASAHSQTATSEKRSPYAPTNPPPEKPPMFSRAVVFGNLLFLSGVGAHFKGSIEEHTRHVIEELEKNLSDAGSSLQKTLKVNVYLNDLKDYDAMNRIYSSYNWGQIPPVRTTVAPMGGIPGNSLVEIDLIAYI